MARARASEKTGMVYQANQPVVFHGNPEDLIPAWIITQSVPNETIEFINSSTPTGTNYSLKARATLIALEED